MTDEIKMLLDDFAALPIENHQQQIDAVIKDARDLIEHGEEGVAFENICQNIYEWNIPLSRANYERLERLGRHYGFENTTWSFLRRL